MATSEQEADTAERVLRAILQLVEEPNNVGVHAPHAVDVDAVRELGPRGWDHVAEYIWDGCSSVSVAGVVTRDQFMAAVHAMWVLGCR